MVDHVSKEVRSKIMASVRSKGNRTTEVVLGRLLWTAGMRGYRKHWPEDGRPDFAWPGLKVAVFVDGCFWHGCTRCKYLPRSRVKFWRNKIETNKRRDRRVSNRLRRRGWTVIRVRECGVRRESTLRKIVRVVKKARRASKNR
ncbi:MAG: DNA mismatch endonuclease Vsr [Bryobacteraceae bacterium]|jgi:DNA mismatch endonuclease (patch repair protein)